MADNNTKIIISAEDKASAALSSISTHVGGLNAALGGLGGTLSSTLTVGGFAALIKATVDAADEMNDLSQRIGVGIKDLAAWKLAADQNGTSLESVGKAVKSLSVYMVDNSEKLRAAGITARDANGALVQLADLFAAMPDGVQKTALATQLMGKAGLEMIPVLNRGSAGLAEARAKADEYGRKLAELAPQADEFNDLVAELGLQAKVVGMNIAGYFVPGLIGLSTWLNDVAKGGEKAKTALDWLDEKLPLGFGLRWAPTLAIAGVGSDPSKRSSGGRIGGAAGGMTLAEELALGEKNTAGLIAMGLLDKDGKAAKAGRGIIGPDDVLDAIRENVAKQNRAAYLAQEKEITAAIEASNKALADHADKLGKDVAAAETALATYGLTESQIADLTLTRLQHARAMEAEQDADAATLAYYDREIEALERIRSAKFAIEAKDTAKKQAEEAAKAWQDFSRDIESSLTDALMRGFENGNDFGENFVESLQNMLKTAALKLAVQVILSPVTGQGGVLQQGAQALGINLGGGGAGGASNLLSLGSNLSNLGGISAGYAGFATSAIGQSLGLSTAMSAGYSAPVFASALEGGALLSAGSGGAAGGLTAAGAGLGAAMPYIGAAIAIASIFGGKLFGSKKPAPIQWALADTPLGQSTWFPQMYSEEGPFSLITTLGQHLKRNGQSMEGLKSSVTDPLVQLDNVLAGYLSGDEKTRVGSALVAGYDGEHPWNQATVEGVMMRRLNIISDAIGGWVDKLADTTTGNLQERYSELAQILSIRGNKEFEKLANDMFNARGVWDYEGFAQLQTAIQAFNGGFLSEADRLTQYSESMRAAFADLNLALPESREGFKALVEDIDTGTASGFELYATLIALSPTMDAYYQALQAERDIKREMATMGASSFATAVDFRRYQQTARTYDAAFAADYAYNIGRGAIQPGVPGGDLVSELRALRSDLQAQNLAIATYTQETAKTLRRWNGDGMPETRTVV